MTTTTTSNATVVQFYEKPGCIGNATQKEMLRAAGYTLKVKDLIERQWTASTLKAFFGDIPVHECVDPRAPGIITGELCPAQMTERQLLEAMIDDPMLIRRPLIAVGEERAVGFRNALVTKLLGNVHD